MRATQEGRMTTSILPLAPAGTSPADGEEQRAAATEETGVSDDGELPLARALFGSRWLTTFATPCHAHGRGL